MNSFYSLNIILQWVISLVLLFLAFVIFYYWLGLMQFSFLAVFLVFVVTPIGQFLIAPLMTLTGIYKYMSPMLLVYAPNPKRYDLHNGTSFDYLFVRQHKIMGRSWQNQLLLFYVEGLLKIIQEIKQNEIPVTIEIRGSSYFFSERTAKRLGFTIKKAGIAEKFNLLINYLDLVWMYSLSKGGINFPKLKDFKTATTTGAKLLEKEEELLALKKYLISRI